LVICVKISTKTTLLVVGTSWAARETDLVDSEFRLQVSRGTFIGQGEGTSGLVRVYEFVCIRVMRLSSQDNPSSVL